MRTARALLASLALIGCGHRSALISVGGNETRTVAAPVPTPDPDAAAWASIARSIATLRREGRIAVNVEAYWPDESPATGVVMEVTDATFHKSTATVDAIGVARLDLGTLNAARWRAGWNGFWRVVGKPQLGPDRSGQPVIRGVMFLPAPETFAATPLPIQAVAPSAASFAYPPEVGSSSLERVAYLRRESLRAKAAALAARERGDEATAAREMARAAEVGAEYARNYEGRE